jgi:hypothetical protein
MTDIDPSEDVRIGRGPDRVTAMLPLAGAITEEWHRRYDALAKAHDVPAMILPGERSWIVVTIPVPAERADVEAALDAARGLGAKIAEDEESAAETEAVVREWWARQRP